MRTKEEILKSNSENTYMDSSIYDGYTSSIYDAMDEYAKEVHFGFRKWVEQIVLGKLERLEQMKKIPAEELYNQFIQSVNKEG